jgi:uncharacterized protein YkwD
VRVNLRQRPTALAVLAGVIVLPVLSATPAVAASRAKPAVHTKAAARAKRQVRRARKPSPAAAKPAAPPPPVAACPNTDVIPTPDNLASVGAAILCLINQQRAVAAEQPLHASPALAAAAASHSLDMAAQDYFGHVPGMDENIAAATGDLATPAAILDDWMGSPGHRANILGPDYTTAGVGVAPVAPALLGPGGGATYTVDFGPTG